MIRKDHTISSSSVADSDEIAAKSTTATAAPEKCNSSTTNDQQQQRQRPRRLTHMGGFSYRTEIDVQPAVQSAIVFIEKNEKNEKTTITIESIKQKICEKILQNPRYYRFYSTIDRESKNFVPMSNVEQEFKLDEHVHCMSLAPYFKKNTAFSSPSSSNNEETDEKEVKDKKADEVKDEAKQEQEKEKEREDEALRNLLSELSSRTLDRSKPLWELIIVQDYSPSLVLVWRVHHVIGDGSAMIICCQSLFDESEDVLHRMEQMIHDQKKSLMFRSKSSILYADGNSNNSINDGSDEKNNNDKENGNDDVGDSWAIVKMVEKLGLARILPSSVYHRIVVPLLTLVTSGIYPTLVMILWFAIGFLRILFKWVWNGVTSGIDPHTVLKREHNAPLTSEKRVAFSVNQIPVDEAKNVARTVDATVNDLILCCLAGAVDQYTRHKNREVKRQDIRITTPVNIRTSIEDFREPRNKFGFMVSNLPLGITDSVQRLRWITREMNYNKTLPERYFTYGLTFFIQKILPPNIMKRFYGYMSYLQSGIVTNVQCPPGQLSIDGTRMTGCFALTPIPPGSSLGVAALSYNGHVNVSINTEKVVIPDPELLLRYMMDEYRSLKSRLLVV